MNKGIPQKTVLDLAFVDLDLDELVDLVAERIVRDGQAYLVTPNPEMMLCYWSDSEFAKVIDAAWLRLADGFGLQWADWFGQRSRWLVYPSLVWFGLFVNRKKLVKRLTGTDFMAKFLLWQKDVPVFLLGAAEGVAEGVVKEFPFANIVGTSNAGPEDAGLIDLINDSGAQVLFVAYGAPKQEKWIVANLPQLTQVKMAIGVGGAFDYLSGRIGRAPRWLQSLGLEWLYRLLKEPRRRLVRIWRAVIVFPWGAATRAHR